MAADPGVEAKLVCEPSAVWDLSVDTVVELFTPLPWVPAINGTWIGERVLLPEANDPLPDVPLVSALGNVPLPEETCGAPAVVA